MTAGAGWRHPRDVPEELFSLGPYRLEPDGSLWAGMPGDSRLVGPDGTASPAALGVFVDEVLGHLVSHAGGRWSVSTDLLLEVVRDLPTDGTELRCEARLLARDDRGATVTGRVTDASGALVAHSLTRGRFVEVAPVSEHVAAGLAALTASHAASDTRAGSAGLLELLGPDVQVDAVGQTVAVQASPRFANPLGNLHGGISLCVSGLLAEIVVPSPSRTAAIRINHVRPIPAGCEVTFTAHVQHHGRTLAVVNVVARTPDGRACTIATVTRH